MPLTPAKRQQLFSIFPFLEREGFTETSLDTTDYNCIAWSLGDTTRFWWPDPTPSPFNPYWPPYVLFLDTVANFQSLYRSHGYADCDGPQLEEGFEKVAIYANGDRVKHAARQLPDGAWTSKLGYDIDISHSLVALEGGYYGSVACVLKRLSDRNSVIAKPETPLPIGEAS
jgi:hypothetical protein